MGLIKRRKKRVSEDKWVLGERLTKAGRERGRRRRQMKKMEGVNVTSRIKPRTAGLKGAKGTVAEKKKAYGIKSKIKKKDLAKTGSELTKAGVYPSYKKKSKSAKSFRSAFKSNCAGKGSGDSFSWQGRSYSCARASDKPAATKKKAVSKSAATKKPAATKKLSYLEKHKQTIEKYKKNKS